MRFFLLFLFLLQIQPISTDEQLSQEQINSSTDFFRKLSWHIECPADYYMVSISAPYFDHWRSYGVTANHLTLMAGIFQLLACGCLYRRLALLAGVLWIFGYYFDAIDGSYARYHYLCSNFGDLFDHIRDWVCTIVLVGVILWRYQWRLFDSIFWVMTLILLGVFLSAQEQYVTMNRPNVEPSWFLSLLKHLTNHLQWPAETLLHTLRWVGVAHINIAIGIYLALFPQFHKQKEEKKCLSKQE